MFTSLVLSLALIGSPSAPAIHSDTAFCSQVSRKDGWNRNVETLKDLFAKKDYQEVVRFSDSIIESAGDEAKRMQESLNEFAWESVDKILSFDALNYVAVALYWKARALSELGEAQKAQEISEQLIDQFFYGQCREAYGFAKPAEDVLRKNVDENH